MKLAALTFLISLMTVQSSLAFECPHTFDYTLPIVKLGETEIKDDFWGAANFDEKVCYDEKEFRGDSEILKNMKSLRESGVLDKLNCLTDKEPSKEETAMLSDIIVKFVSRPIHLYALADEKNGEVRKIVFTNSKSDDFAGNSLNAKDKIELTGVTLVSSGLGILIERSVFKDQKDKHMHAFAGAAINVGSNLASYVVIEEMGVGDKLKLSKNQKKAAILLTGSVMGLLVGYAKERLYDYYRQKNHTYDPKLKGDMGATWLGGGALTPVYVTFKTVW